LSSRAVSAPRAPIASATTPLDVMPIFFQKIKTKTGQTRRFFAAARPGPQIFVSDGSAPQELGLELDSLF
jgi:hypothetical protein